jgi:hypothetical protein
MTTEMRIEAARPCDDEEAFLWATASLGEARRGGKRRSAGLLEAVVEDLAFGLGAGRFPPAGARTTRGLPRYAATARRPA